MKKNKIMKMLAAAGFSVLLTNSHFTVKPYAKADFAEKKFAVSGTEECRRLLMELVSSGAFDEREEYYVTGKDYEPETLVIAQMFPDAVNISNTKIREYTEGGHRYVTCRIGFERRNDSHDQDDREAVEGDTEDRRWSAGDIQMQKIGNEVYRFRCIDDDYEDNSGYQKCALFLCETMIRSDIESTDSERIIMPFGESNNYKFSKVRQWLDGNTDQGGMSAVNIGANTAFIGATVSGVYHEFSESVFLRQDIPFQNINDRIFLLSLEEAMRYKEELWTAEGKECPYSRGFWLRTPAFGTGDDGKFKYGTYEYAVDLEHGSIRPINVDDGSIGIRPAFCLPQM